MKIAHWTIGNRSGMFRVAESIADAEKKLGLNSVLINLDRKEEWEAGDDADIHVSHTWLPDIFQKIKAGKKVVWVGHGVPEHVFHSSATAHEKGVYGAGDSWMLIQFFMQNADAIVTFWPRHAALYQSMCDKNTKVDCIPLGVDLDFWKPTESRGKYAGEPSLFSCENAHYIKWPLDLFITYGYVLPEFPSATLHCVYLPMDQHRFFFPLVNRNGAGYGSFISANVFDHEMLRNAFVSTDYFIGLVRYGDFNRACLEAKACGSKVISYRGNPYADFWLTEGDQREMAVELLRILRNEVDPLQTERVPSIVETAKAMKEIYERIL